LNDTFAVAPTVSRPPARQSFAALRHSGYRAQFVTYFLAMMADNIEHVISYWVVFQKFHSPALAGFAVLSHWLPFLLFSVVSGVLADRFDPRRLIQCGMGLFILASLGWGYFFLTDTIEVWHAMVLLLIHGCAGVLWATPGQVLLYDIVGPADLPSGVRLNATSRYLGILVGPAVGSAILLAFGPAYGILLNTVFYLPAVLWLVNAPYSPRFRKGAASPKRAVRGFADIVQAMREIAGDRIILSMTVLAGCHRFSSATPTMRNCPGSPKISAMAIRASPTACCSPQMPRAVCWPGWCSKAWPAEARPAHRHRARAVVVLRADRFAVSDIYPVALVLLFAAGFLELAFNAMAQALVQLNAHEATRGRTLGLFNMASMGLRAFSGITVGLIGSIIGVHWSLALSALVLLAAITCLLLWIGLRRSPAQSMINHPRNGRNTRSSYHDDDAS
jgi:MFS family permease